MMPSLAPVEITRLSDGEKFEGTAYHADGKYEAIWYEGGLRFVFFFDEKGTQVGSSKYSLRLRSV